MIHLIIIQNFRAAKKLSMPRNTTQLNLSQHMFWFGGVRTIVSCTPTINSKYLCRDCYNEIFVCNAFI